MPSTQNPYNRPADYSLAFGCGGLAAFFVPAVGDYLAIGLAIASIILGGLGILYQERGLSSKLWTATFGIVLSAIVLFTAFLMWMSSPKGQALAFS